jgi:hypothetical protein
LPLVVVTVAGCFADILSVAHAAADLADISTRNSPAAGTSFGPCRGIDYSSPSALRRLGFVSRPQPQQSPGIILRGWRRPILGPYSEPLPRPRREPEHIRKRQQSVRGLLGDLQIGLAGLRAFRFRVGEIRAPHARVERPACRRVSGRRDRKSDERRAIDRAQPPAEARVLEVDLAFGRTEFARYRLQERTLIVGQLVFGR